MPDETQAAAAGGEAGAEQQPHPVEAVRDVYFSPLHNSSTMRPVRINFMQKGEERFLDILEVNDSVVTFVFNVERKVFVFIKQFRPAKYLTHIAVADRDAGYVDLVKYPPALGVVLELSTALITSKRPLADIASDALFHQTGYKVKNTNLEIICTCRVGVGIQGSKMTLYYCEVNDSMKLADGGGVDDSVNAVVEMSLAEGERLLLDKAAAADSPPSLLYTLMWFLHAKAHNFR